MCYPAPPKSKDSLCLEQLGSLCVRLVGGPGLQPCVYERVNGSAMAPSVGECAATVCISEEEGFQQGV